MFISNKFPPAPVMRDEDYPDTQPGQFQFENLLFMPRWKQRIAFLFTGKIATHTSFKLRPNMQTTSGGASFAMVFKSESCVYRGPTPSYMIEDAHITPVVPQHENSVATINEHHAEHLVSGKIDPVCKECCALMRACNDQERA